MVQIPGGRVERFRQRAARELRSQLPIAEATEPRLMRVRSLALRAGFLTELEWGLDLPHPDISHALLEVAADSSEEMSWLSQKIDADNQLGCWTLPLASEYDSKNRARYPTLTAKRFDAKSELAHRFVVRRTIDWLLTEQHLDHLCRDHACCNLTHLEIITHRSNVRRGGSARSSVKGQLRLH